MKTCQDCRFFHRSGASGSGWCRVTAVLVAVCRSCFAASSRRNGELYECGRCGEPNRADPVGRRGCESFACELFEASGARGDLLKNDLPAPLPCCPPGPVTGRQTAGAGRVLSSSTVKP